MDGNEDADVIRGKKNSKYLQRKSNPMDIKSEAILAPLFFIQPCNFQINKQI